MAETKNDSATPPTVESLSADLAAARSANAEKDQTIANLQEQVQQGQADLATLKAQVQEGQTIIEEQGTTIDDLDAKLAAAQGTPVTEPRFTVGKKTYGVSANTFNYKGEKYTAAQLLANKKLQAELVGKGVGFIVEITE